MTSIEIYEMLKKYWDEEVLDYYLLDLIFNKSTGYTLTFHMNMRDLGEVYSMGDERYLRSLIHERIKSDKYLEKLRENPTDLIREYGEPALNSHMVSHVKSSLELWLETIKDYLDELLEKNYPNDLIIERLGNLGGVTSDDEINRERRRFIKEEEE